jgi:CO dehydrogenase/acetyl-CoA synthase gamma subunit (corrinoid Fe-S protein)
MLKTPLEIYKLLPKTNCRHCRLSSCMAFAAAAIKEERQLADCPHLNKFTQFRYEGEISKPLNLESIQEKTLIRLKKKFREST